MPTIKTSLRPGITSCKAFAAGTDTLVATAASVTPGTNDTSFYTIVFTTLAAAWYRLLYYKGARLAAIEERVYIAGDTVITPIPPPATAGLTTVRVMVINQAGPLADCSVSVEPIEKNAAVSSSLVARTVYGGVTTVSGYVDLVMIQAASFSKGLGLYKLRVSDPAGKIIAERTVTVPSVSSCYASDLVDA